MPDPFDRVLDLVSTLSHPELKRLQLVVNELVEHGYFPRPGSIEYRFISRHGKVYGPYKYRRVWQQGKLKDFYEGKASPDEYQRWLEHKANRKPAVEGVETERMPGVPRSDATHQ